MTNDMCDFNLGKCKHGFGDFLEETKPESFNEQVKVFREAYCNPCLESMKLQELKDIKQELSWIREAQDNR